MGARHGDEQVVGLARAARGAPLLLQILRGGFWPPGTHRGEWDGDPTTSRATRASIPRRDKITRSEFIRRHVGEVQRIRAEGVPLIGYLHWSLFDNYEWGSYTPRFGLFALDYPRGLDRCVEDPWGDRPSETYAELVACGPRE
jgi:hypothetical protein